MREHRVSWAAAERIAAGLSERDQAIVSAVGRVRVLTGRQLERLHFADLQGAHRDRTRRRVLARLVTLQVLTTLERRIGGARAGSAGLVFVLGLVGQRLATLSPNLSPNQGSVTAGRARQPHTPTDRFLKHSLAVSELYVQLVELARQQSFTLAGFQGEPACWWLDSAGSWIKPDAYACLETTDVTDTVTGPWRSIRRPKACRRCAASSWPISSSPSAARTARTARCCLGCSSPCPMSGSTPPCVNSSKSYPTRLNGCSPSSSSSGRLGSWRRCSANDGHWHNVVHSTAHTCANLC